MPVRKNSQGHGANIGKMCGRLTDSFIFWL